MIDSDTEKQFRHYVQVFPLIGDPQRATLERIWRTVIGDADVQRVLQRMLFIPHSVPDQSQGERLIKILDHLHGQPTSLEFFDDIVVTQAEIVSVRVVRDSEGPSYFVGYTYSNGVTAEREFGYDSYHAATCGWDDAALKAYWYVGNRATCHYRASDPRQHAICQP